MKATKWGLTVMVLIVAGLVFAEAAPERGAGAPERSRRPEAATRGRAPINSEQMYQERMAQQAEVHQAAIKELMDIKVIAEEENATRTAEAIQALIDKKNADYKKGIEQVERARRERAERLQQRMQQTETQQRQRGESNRPQTEAPAAEDKADETQSD